MNPNHRPRGGRGDGSDSGGGRHDGGYRGAGGGSGRYSNNNNNNSDLPWEDGIVCNLRESFGFIYCADRPDEVFFHYSQLDRNDFPTAACLTMDQEVTFQVGPSKFDPNKLAAFNVRKCLQPIVWETRDGTGEGDAPIRVRGLVEKPSSSPPPGTGGERPNGDRPGVNHYTSTDGTIRVLMKEEEGVGENDNKKKDAPKENQGGGDGENDNRSATTLSADGPTVRFAMDGYRTNGANRLLPGDLVEFEIVTDRRTKSQYARNIVLLQSEKDRARSEADKKMLEDATLEHGVITSLKGDYGFLKSNKRREEVFFHYSSIELEGEGEGEDMVLREGQDMQFLVVTESGTHNPAGSSERRVSARQVKIQPRGSVQFHDSVCKCRTGVVLYPPQPHDSGHMLDQHGKIRLHNPVTIDNPDTGEQKKITEVYLHIKDAPGGSFAFRGGTSVGMWVQAGDTLLFDVVQDFVDGTCHAGPTASLTPTDTDPQAGGKEPPAVRLIGMALAMRAEGIVNAVKDTYGFLHYAERPVDVHFKLFQVMPDPLQRDLRRNILGYEEKETRPLKLEVGVEASFDLSVHGMIHNHPTPQGGGQQTRGKIRKGGTSNQERENLKAQRILFLPPRTIFQNKTLGSSVEGVICKQDAKQPYAGMVELSTPLHSMTLEERHPLVVKMLDTYMKDQTAVEPLIFHDIQSPREDEILFTLIEKKYPGQLSWRHTTEDDKDEIFWPTGKLVLTKGAEDPSETNKPPLSSAASESDDELGLSLDGYSSGDADVDLDMEDGPTNEATKSPKTKKNKTRSHQDSKIVKTVRYDKGGMSGDLKKDVPPNVGDKVVMDIRQSRRTGVVSVLNMKILKRKEEEAPAAPEPVDGSALGVVTEVVAARKFGFISVVDDTAEKHETVFFQFSSIDGRKQVRKGDEVRFQIHTEKNGKRVALHISVLPKGGIPSKHDKSVCNGIVLLQPTATKLKAGTSSRSSKLQHAHSNASTLSSGSSRWESGEEGGKEESSFNELGCILLTSDPTNMFSNGEDKKIPFHLHYKNGAIAVHGAGPASSATGADDGSHPRRGDLVSFVKTKNKEGTVRDIRIVKRGFATLLRGTLFKLLPEAGTATFVATNNNERSYTISLSEVVGVELSLLKEGEEVEAILHEGSLFGICRTSDLYLVPTASVGAGPKNKKERPRLNLTVKKDRGGTIMAQSMMAKGPDGTYGFAPGWTTRISKFAS